jgi:hypothetical protein
LLTDLYDSADIRTGGGTIGRGKTLLKNLYVTFLSASTPSWLYRSVNADVVEGGFTSRCIFVHEEEPKAAIAWPDEAVDASSARENLVHKFKNAASTASGVGNIRLSPGALNLFTGWYGDRDIHLDPFRASFESREDAHVLRMAATLCISDNSFNVQHSHVLAAIEIISEAKERAAVIFEGSTAPDRTTLGIDKVRTFLIACGVDGATQSEVTRTVATYMKSEDVRIALDIMHDLGMVQRFEQSVGGRPATVWRATPTITGKDAMLSVLRRVKPR